MLVTDEQAKNLERLIGGVETHYRAFARKNVWPLLEKKVVSDKETLSWDEATKRGTYVKKEEGAFGKLSDGQIEKTIDDTVIDLVRQKLPSPERAWPIWSSVVPQEELGPMVAQLARLAFLLASPQTLVSMGVLDEAAAAAVMAGSLVGDAAAVDSAIEAAWSAVDKGYTIEQKAALLATLMDMVAPQTNDEEAQAVQSAAEAENVNLKQSLSTNEEELATRKAWLARAEEAIKAMELAKKEGREYEPPSWEEMTAK